MSKTKRKRIYRPPQKRQQQGVNAKANTCVVKTIKPVIDFAKLAKQYFEADKVDVAGLAKVQEAALNEAVLRFNKEPVIVPCDAAIEFDKKSESMVVRYFSDYDDIYDSMMLKLNSFGLFIAFTDVKEHFDSLSNVKVVQVSMLVKHELGGTLSFKSKPVPVIATVIDGINLTIDQCYSTAVTRAKRDVLLNSVFNFITDKPECYKFDHDALLKQLSDENGQLPVSRKNAILIRDMVQMSSNKDDVTKLLKMKFDVSSFSAIRNNQLKKVKEFIQSKINDEFQSPSASVDDGLVTDDIDSSESLVSNETSDSSDDSNITDFVNDASDSIDEDGLCEEVQKEISGVDDEGASVSIKDHDVCEDVNGESREPVDESLNAEPKKKPPKVNMNGISGEQEVKLFSLLIQRKITKPFNSYLKSEYGVKLLNEINFTNFIFFFYFLIM